MTWNEGYQVWLTESQSMQNAQLVANHFKGTDWTKESIAALVGNMRHESTINPNMYEYGYDWSADRGFGLVQWTPRSKYWDWATARNLPQRSGDSQLDRIDYEVENNIQWIKRAAAYDLTFAEFRANTQGLTVNQLTEAFTWGYERPNQQAGEQSMPDRQAFARKALAELDWTGTGGGGTDPGTPSRPNGTGTTVQSHTTPPQHKYETEGTLDNMTYYKVKAGDTLSQIAKRKNVKMSEILKVKYAVVLNVNELKVGEVLLLPNTSKPAPTPAKATNKTYTVKSGDYLGKIAKNLNVSQAHLIAKNNLKNPDKIYVGQKLVY